VLLLNSTNKQGQIKLKQFGSNRHINLNKRQLLQNKWIELFITVYEFEDCLAM